MSIKLIRKYDDWYEPHSEIYVVHCTEVIINVIFSERIVISNYTNAISFLYVCIVSIKLKYNFVETPRKFVFGNTTRKLQ